jgi:DNA adenine methylase
VGGKQRLAAAILAHLKRVAGQRTKYFEPFLGGGSVFYHLAPQKAILGDLNADLINFYSWLGRAPLKLRWEASDIDRLGVRDEYDAARLEFNSGASGLRRAALFLYLNRTGFNGIWRVNRAGMYTVPYGGRRLALLPHSEWLNWSRSFRSVTLRASDYGETLSYARHGDVAYLDPPYYDSTGRELFTRYTHSGFTLDNHKALAATVRRLTELDVYVVLTIRDDPEIRLLYADYKVDNVIVSSGVGATGNHRRTVDLVIRNFD